MKLATIALGAALTFPSLAAAQQAQPRYQTMMQAELQAMGLQPQCSAVQPTSGSCNVRAQASDQTGRALVEARRYLLTLQYDDNTDTIYIYVDHYGTLRADASNLGEATRRLLAINWEMLVGKLEWNAASSELRLSAVLNTDSNFDRRAFRGLVRSLLRLADRYASEVSRLTGAPVGETVAPTPAATTPAAATTATTAPAAAR